MMKTVVMGAEKTAAESSDTSVVEKGCLFKVESLFPYSLDIRLNR